MKKLFTFFAAVLMAATMFAGRTFDGTEVLYLKASAVDWWQNANAVQKATFDDTDVVVGVQDANNSGYVGFTVPVGTYTTVKFSRHETAESDAWNSTGNINIAAEGNCVMTFDQNSSDATWGTYDPSHVEVTIYSVKTNWKEGGWGAGFKELTVNDDGTQSMTETYTGNGFNIKPNFLGTDWYPVDKLNLVGGVAANDLVTISVNPNATSQEEVFTITKISSPEPELELDPINVTVRVYTTAAAPKIWWWGGDIAGADATYSWDGRPSMNKEGETNWYYWTFEGVNATSGISYKITATTEKEFSGVKEDKCLDANLNDLDCEYAPEPEPQPETTDITVRVYTTAAAPKIWWWGGDIAAPTMEWDDRPSMTKEGETNWYSWTFEGVNATSGISYKITATAAEAEFTGIKEDKCYGYDLAEIDCESTPTPDPEPENITLYFVNTVGYEAVYAYVWDESNNPYKTYPGEEATLTAETLGDYAVYSYTFPDTYTHIIFCNGKTGADERKAFEGVIDPAKPYITEVGAVAELNDVVTVDATISAYQYSTLYSDKALRIPAGVKVEYVSDVADGALVTETLTDIIPANTGVMISGPAETTFTFVEAKTVDPIEGNMLKGTTTNTEINNSFVHYILSLDENDVFGLYWPYNTTNGVGAFTNQAGKAYLELPGDVPAPRRFVLRPNQVLTAIESVETTIDATKIIKNGQVLILRDGGAYNLLGVRIF